MMETSFLSYEEEKWTVLLLKCWLTAYLIRFRALNCLDLSSDNYPSSIEHAIEQLISMNNRRKSEEENQMCDIVNQKNVSGLDENQNTSNVFHPINQTLKSVKIIWILNKYEEERTNERKQIIQSLLLLFKTSTMCYIQFNKLFSEFGHTRTRTSAR